MKKLLGLFLLLASFLHAQVVQIAPQSGSVTGIVVSCSPNLIPVGGFTQCISEVLVAGISTNNITNSGLWSCASGCGFIKVSSSGRVTGVSGGVGVVQFSEGGFSNTSSVTVAAAPVISQAGMTNCSTLCTLPQGNNGFSYSFTFTASGGVVPYTWSIIAGSIAGSGLSLNASTGLLSGTAVTGVYNFTIKVTGNDGGNTSLALTLTISSSAPACGPPNYNCSNRSTSIVPEPTTTPTLSIPCTVNSIPTGCKTFSGGFPVQIRDSSYDPYGGNQTRQTRCTGPLSAQDLPNRNYASGLGGSSLFPLVNANSTAMMVDAAFTFMTLLKKDSNGYYYCAPPIYSVPGEPAAGPHDVALNPTHCNIDTECSIFTTRAMNLVNPGSNLITSNGLTFDWSGGGFDWVDPSIWWSFGTSGLDANNLHINKVELQGTGSGPSFVPNGSLCFPNNSGLGDCPSSHSSTWLPVPTVDFTLGLPVGANVAERVQNTHYNAGTYVSHTMFLPGSTRPEIYQYIINSSASSVSYPPGALIQPGANGDGISSNVNFCAYKNTTTVNAFTGATPPAFNESPCGSHTYTETSCGTGNTCAKWVGINTPGTGTSGQNGPKFVLQAIVGGTTTNFAFTPYFGSPNPLNPNLNGVLIDGGVTWQNSGPDYVPSSGGAHVTVAGVSSDQTKFGVLVSTNSYGPNVKGTYTGSAGQDTDFYVSEANQSDPITTKPTFYVLNTLTGWQVNFTCSGSTLSACGTTTQTPLTAAYNAIVSTNGSGTECNFPVHNFKLSTDGLSAFVTAYKPGYYNPSSFCQQFPNFYEWAPMGINGTGTHDFTQDFQIYADGMPHFGVLHTHIAGFHNGGYGQNVGVRVPIYSVWNVSGNNGGLPPGCSGPIASGGSCAICPAGGCTQIHIPYSYSVNGSCSTSTSQQVTNAGYTTGGVQPGDFVGLQSQVGLNTIWGPMTGPLAASCSGPNCTTAAVPCNIAGIYDSHFVGNYNPGFTDTTGLLIGALNNAGLNATLPTTTLQNQLVGFPMGPTCDQTGQPACFPPSSNQGTAISFAHTFAMNNESSFSVQIQNSTSSTDGTNAAYGTSWRSQFGSGGPNGTGVPIQDGSGAQFHYPVAYVALQGMPATPFANAGYTWFPSYPYVVGNTIGPIGSGSTVHGQPGFDIFEAIAATGGTLCSSQPCSGTTQPIGLSPYDPVKNLTGYISPTASVTITGGGCTQSGTTVTCLSTLNPVPQVSGGTVGFVGITGNTAYNGTWPACQVSVTTCSSTQFQMQCGGAGQVSCALGSGTGGLVYQRGSQVQDNGILWQDVGPNTEKGDVVLATLE